jgi:hypothetical protein
MGRKEYQSAADAYTRAAAMHDDTGVRNDIGVCFAKLGQKDRALAVFRQLRDEHPDDWQALYNEAVVLMENGDLRGAAKVAARVRRLHPVGPEYLRLSAGLLSRGIEEQTW